MKRSLVFPLLFFPVALSGGLALASEREPSYPPHTIPGSELRVLPTNGAGRHYQLSVGLPASYAKETGRRYPVVYVTDGYWDFEKLDAIRGALVFDKVAPEFIIVGIGYAGENLDYGRLREWELSPVPFGDRPGTGHAADFLATIETQIIPFVEREYRADPAHRVLAGASLGGLFTLYAMYSRPDLFSAWVAVTPAVAVNDGWLLGYRHAAGVVYPGSAVRPRTAGAGAGTGHLSVRSLIVTGEHKFWCLLAEVRAISPCSSRA